MSPTSPTSDDWEGQSPRKRTQTLPNLTQGAAAARLARDESTFRWSRIQETCEEKDEKTFSEDIFKTLDLQGVSPFTSPLDKTKNIEEEEEEAERTNVTDSERSSTRTADLSPSNAAFTPKAQSTRLTDLYPVREEPLGSASASPQYTPDTQGEGSGNPQSTISRFVELQQSQMLKKLDCYISMQFKVTLRFLKSFH